MNLPTTDDSQQNSSAPNEQLRILRDRLSTDSDKKQLEALSDVEKLGEAGTDILVDFLSKRKANTVLPSDGKAYQILHHINLEEAKHFLSETFPNGLVPMQSERGVDYQSLQDLLVLRQFQDADRLTLEKMCELAGDTTRNRKWLYFSEVKQFPIADLKTIDRLWFIYSEGRFGFSVQRELWMTVGGNWDRFWPKIGWRKNNNWTRYPDEFIWNTSAPMGHLPLSNQLRGVRVIEALMNHPAWKVD